MFQNVRDSIVADSIDWIIPNRSEAGANLSENFNDKNPDSASRTIHERHANSNNTVVEVSGSKTDAKADFKSSTDCKTGHKLKNEPESKNDFKIAESFPESLPETIFKNSWSDQEIKLSSLVEIGLVEKAQLKMSKTDLETALSDNLFGKRPIEALQDLASGEKMSVLKAANKGVISTGIAFSLLEAQAACGQILIDYKSKKRMRPSEAWEGKFVNSKYKMVLLRAEKAVLGYSGNGGSKLSVYEAVLNRIQNVNRNLARQVGFFVFFRLFSFFSFVYGFTLHDAEKLPISEKIRNYGFFIGFVLLALFF